MFYSLTGKIVYFDDANVAVCCSGVSFLCATTTNTLNKIAGSENEITLYTHLSVREDAMDLYGFYDKKELECFKLLITVSGVGPKMALAVLSNMTPTELAVAIAAEDAKAISAAPGLGAKKANRIILELKEKMAAGIPEKINVSDLGGAFSSLLKDNAREAVDALCALGYSKAEATNTVSKLDPHLSVEELIKLALKAMSVL